MIGLIVEIVILKGNSQFVFCHPILNFGHRFTFKRLFSSSGVDWSRLELVLFVKAWLFAVWDELFVACVDWLLRSWYPITTGCSILFKLGFAVLNKIMNKSWTILKILIVWVTGDWLSWWLTGSQWWS
jgi:hypothetical protein